MNTSAHESAPKTCIIGAGISGLARAWQLKRSGGDCTVLEQSALPGGAMRSHREGDYLAEEGPNSILLNSLEIEAFLDSIPGLNDSIIEALPEANKRFIVRECKAHAVPMGPISAITTPLWSFAGKLRVLKEPFIKAAPANGEESVADFVRRRLGDELYRYAINPLVGGIYAGDPEKLSLPHAFPKLHALDQNHGGLIRGGIAKMRAAHANQGPKPRKRIISFKNGMAEFPEKLAAALGNTLHTAVSISSIRKADSKWAVAWKSPDGTITEDSFDKLILTIPAHRLEHLPFGSVLQGQLAAFEAIDYPPVSVLSLAFKRADVAHPIDGFGALVPECEGRKILGVLFPSSLFPQRAPEGEVLLTVFIGGERQPECATADTKTLMRTVLPELEQLLGVTGQPTFVHHKHWDKAIPQYKLGYGAHLAEMERIEQLNSGLHLAGNYRTGISVTYCLEAALK
ncbi:MAG: oxygen-dependent protoporphyrinogen oxidase [Lentimonas sp.]|jgi:oxygen-dependent protoporphyrinogen oxidase